MKLVKKLLILSLTIINLTTLNNTINGYYPKGKYSSQLETIYEDSNTALELSLQPFIRQTKETINKKNKISDYDYWFKTENVQELINNTRELETQWLQILWLLENLKESGDKPNKNNESLLDQANANRSILFSPVKISASEQINEVFDLNEEIKEQTIK